MSHPVSEVCTVPLKPGVEIEDESSDSGKLWESILATISAQPGYERSFAGRYVESADTAQLIIEWTTLGDHETFQRAPEYGPFMKSFSPLISSAPSVYHVQFSSPFTGPASAPVTEMVTMYFAASYSNSELDSPYKSFTDGLSSADGFLAVCGGWTIEEVEHSSLDGAKGKSFVFTVGWESVEQHMKFRETQTFKDTIGPLRDQGKAMEMHHVPFSKY